MTAANGRKADHPINTQFLQRWSPRAFTGEAIPEAELNIILEAARWAPSAYNSQPWRLIYARRDTPHWNTLFGLLNEGNQAWAKNGAAIIVIASKAGFIGPNGAEMTSATPSYDSGAAWGFLALQAALSGWAAHGIIGFDRDRAKTELKLPAEYHVDAGVVIGRQGDKSILPEALAAREIPNVRKPLSEIAFEGAFKG